MHFFCMPSTASVSKSTSAPKARKPRARKAATPKARTRKVAPTKPTSATPLPVVITPDAPSVKASYAKIELKSLKDYPRDGLSLILLPLLYLEAFTKELLPVIGRIKF